MELQTVEIPRAGARERAAEYRREAKRTTDPAARAELEQIARAYRIAARDEVPLISLTRTIAAGGTMRRTRVIRRWRDGQHVEARDEYLLPRLAVCRSDASFVFTLGVERGGRVRFVDQLRPHWRYVRGRLSIAAGFDLPAGFEPGGEITTWTGSAWATIVPVVPPQHRPERGGIGGCLTLWEVDEWRWMSTPRPPGDPALLRHVAGDIYAVLSVWDLTELEQLVLAGRRVPAEGRW